jgi:hypothetical protein
MEKDGIPYDWCSFEKRWGHHKVSHCFKKQAHDDKLAEENEKAMPPEEKSKPKTDKAKVLAPLTRHSLQ